jgi:hypothetical protein
LVTAWAVGASERAARASRVANIVLGSFLPRLT